MVLLIYYVHDHRLCKCQIMNDESNSMHLVQKEKDAYLVGVAKLGIINRTRKV